MFSKFNIRLEHTILIKLTPMIDYIKSYLINLVYLKNVR